MSISNSLAVLCAGYVLDLIFGDPHGFPHIIVFAGKLIDRCERFLRPIFPATKRGERAAGTLLVLVVVGVCTALPWLLLDALFSVARPVALVAESFICYQLLATRALRDESLKVYDALKAGDLAASRTAVSMIVGRDVARLDETGVTKAAVETVAENTADGIVCPLLWMGLAGLLGLHPAVGGCFCKAVNTMDSMIGYENARYRYFGTVAAKLDDAVNFIPARVAGMLMVCAAWLCGFDGRNAWRVFVRDRLKHASPNSAHTEAACAGALRVQLAGPAYYEGELEEKPYLGDPLRPVEIEDIRRSHRLMFMTAHLTFIIAAIMVLLAR